MTNVVSMQDVVKTSFLSKVEAVISRAREAKQKEQLAKTRLREIRSTINQLREEEDKLNDLLSNREIWGLESEFSELIMNEVDRRG